VLYLGQGTSRAATNQDPRSLQALPRPSWRVPPLRRGVPTCRALGRRPCFESAPERVDSNESRPPHRSGTGASTRKALANSAALRCTSHHQCALLRRSNPTAASRQLTTCRGSWSEISNDPKFLSCRRNAMNRRSDCVRPRENYLGGTGVAN
jgi:hypothetical protein